MTCNVSYVRLFFKRFFMQSKFDTQPICTFMLAKFYSCKKLVLQFCWRDNEAAQDSGWAGRLLGAKTSSQEQGPRFNLVRTSHTVVIRETREATRMTCCSSSSPA
jgi:hypothetical protein